MRREASDADVAAIMLWFVLFALSFIYPDADVRACSALGCVALTLVIMWRERMRRKETS